MTNQLTSSAQSTEAHDTRGAHQSGDAVSRSKETWVTKKSALPSPNAPARGAPAGRTDSDNDAPTLPPALEFTRLINNQFLATTRQHNAASMLRIDPRSIEEAIANRADLYREVSRAHPDATQDSGLPRSGGRPAISPTTARLWARLDADDFRTLNQMDRDLYTHVAQWMDENPSPAYQDALRQYAPDIFNIVGATRRVRDVFYSPVRQLPAKTRDRGQITLPFDSVEARRFVLGGAPRCGR